MLQLIEYSAADDAVVAVVAELLEAAAVDGERLEAVAAVGSTAGHVSVAVAVGIHKTDNPVLLHWPSVQKSSHPFSMLNAKFFHCNIMAMIYTPQKISIFMAIFGSTWTWKDTWMGHKSVPSIYFHCLWCVLAHYPVSLWFIFAPYGVLSFWLIFTPKTTHFWTHLDPEWHLDGA